MARYTEVDLEAAAEQIRKAVEIYRALNAVADMLDVLDPLADAEETLRAQVAQHQAECERLSREELDYKRRANAARAEYDGAMATLERDLALRARDYEKELEAKHAEGVARVAAVAAEAVAVEERLADATARLAGLRDLLRI